MKKEPTPLSSETIAILKRARDDLNTPIPAIAAVEDGAGYVVWIQDPRRNGPVGVRTMKGWYKIKDDLCEAWEIELKRRKND